MIKIIREVGSYIMIYNDEEYFINNGNGKVGNDNFDVGYMLNCSSVEFVNKCLDLFD